jgi:hypothetical protein
MKKLIVVTLMALISTGNCFAAKQLKKKRFGRNKCYIGQTLIAPKPAGNDRYFIAVGNDELFTSERTQTTHAYKVVPKKRGKTYVKIYNTYRGDDGKTMERRIMYRVKIK